MKIDIKLTSVEVKAEVRELRCEWSSELARDIGMFSSIDPYVGVDDFLRRTLRKESINNIFNKKHDK
jgi:hypothetical protein